MYHKIPKNHPVSFFSIVTRNGTVEKCQTRRQRKKGVAARSHSNGEKDQKGRYLRRESFSGTCARSFYVGDAVKKEDIHAKFEDGILHITLPAPQQQKALPVNPNLIEIE